MKSVINVCRQLSITHANAALLTLCAYLISNPVEASNDQPTITSIDILEQPVDFSQLHYEDYRKTLPFGDRLLSAFDTVLPYANCPDRLDLPYNLNTVTLHYSLPDWRSPHKVQYTHLLEGSDQEWSEPSEEPFTVLRDLPAGTHVFRVKARDGSGNWSLQNSFEIVIGKPWWLTGWAKAAMVLIILGIVALYARYWQQRRAEIREMQRLLEAYSTASDHTFSGFESADKGDGFLRLINRTLEEHLSDENFGIAELCELLNISRTHLHRKLKKLTGLSTSHYIRYLRLQMAKELFRDPSLNVSEVAFAVGFSNAAYFSRVFKEMYGISPTEAREQMQ